MDTDREEAVLDWEIILADVPTLMLLPALKCTLSTCLDPHLPE